MHFEEKNSSCVYIYTGSYGRANYFLQSAKVLRRMRIVAYGLSKQLMLNVSSHEGSIRQQQASHPPSRPWTKQGGNTQMSSGHTIATIFVADVLQNTAWP